MRTIVKDSDVAHIWCDPETKEEIVVYSSFYKNSGTPITDEGDDMEYVRTEVRGVLLPIDEKEFNVLKKASADVLDGLCGGGYFPDDEDDALRSLVDKLSVTGYVQEPSKADQHFLVVWRGDEEDYYQSGVVLPHNEDPTLFSNNDWAMRAALSEFYSEEEAKALLKRGYDLILVSTMPNRFYGG
jgi:hypothetical protein